MKIRHATEPKLRSCGVASAFAPLGSMNGASGSSEWFIYFLSVYSNFEYPLETPVVPKE